MAEGTWWEKNYREGGVSGKGSIGEYRKWKWKIIKDYTRLSDKTVLDVGCGDQTFLKKKKFKEYTGIDASAFIIEQNRKKHPEWTFIHGDATAVQCESVFDVVLCMDVLFHIMDETKFSTLLHRLNEWAGEWLFINTWSKNPLDDVHDGEYQYFRNLHQWLDHLTSLRLVGEHPHDDGFNTLYVFRKMEQ